MPRIVYRGETYHCRRGETVLEAFLRQGVDVLFSCRNGICQVCLQRCVNGTLPDAAQVGLRQTLRNLGYFLPCKCTPQEDIEIAPPREADLYSPVVVHAKELLAPDVCRLLLEPATPLYYHAGQFLNVRRPDCLTRSYSLASLPQEDYFLELHIRRMANGAMSNWLFDELRVNDELEIQGPQGNCYYESGRQDGNLLLIGTGTGLAPLVGIARDALYAGHTGQIYLYHGSRHARELYLRDHLTELSRRHPNFHYTACVSGREVPSGCVTGRAHDIAMVAHQSLQDWRVYLAGHPEMVYSAQSEVRVLGASAEDIHADPFEFKDLRRRPRSHVQQSSTAAASGAPLAPSGVNMPVPPAERRQDLPPDPEMWAALREGVLLSEILKDFYDQVFNDPRLAPYFQHVTKQRLIEKVFSFMRQIFTGEKIYFGDRPRNAHHWMVISDELFDYREGLMESCLKRHGLPEHLIRRWRAVEENYRADIVKPVPWKRIVGGIELPLDGFGETTLAVGTLCDGCAREIAAGEKARYHLRLGTTYCQSCMAREAKAMPAT